MKPLFIALLSLTAVGCRCGTSGGQTDKPTYTADPKALRFTACSTQDEMGKPVADVFPDQQSVTIKNIGKVGGGFKASFSGTDSAAFSLGPDGAPTAIAGGAEISLPVRFAPTKKGDSNANLVISDEVDGTDDITVSLNGQGSTLAAQPKLQVTMQNKDLPAQYDPCLEQQDGNLSCTQTFADTIEKESSTLEIKLKNLGCPALKITSMELMQLAGSTDPLSFFIDAPAVPPSEASPLVLADTGGTPESTVKIRFAPPPGDNSTRVAYLHLKLNDPKLRDSNDTPLSLDIVLQGVAVKASVFANPTRCNFSDPADDCGITPKQDGKSRFLIKNDGSANITIDSVTFKSNMSETSSQGGRFTITKNPKGMTVAPGSNGAELEISHSEMPLFVQDQVVVSATLGGSGAGSGGRATLALSGGKQPCLTTDPAPSPSGLVVLDFGEPTTELSAKALTIKNGSGAQCGELIVNAVAVDQSPFFSLIDPLVMPGIHLAPGATTEATVQFKRPSSGGTQTGTLRIDANDARAQGPQYFQVQLISNAPLDQRPVPVLKGCIPPDTSCAMAKENGFSVSLAMLGATKELILTAKDSYDPLADGGTSLTQVKNFQFRLPQKPSNAGNALLEKEGIKQTSNQVKLTLDPAALGTYTVTLVVWDDRDQQSGGTAELIINVKQ
ncbi:MAG: choice-of-anchor D domain-containing protein [Myxococcaceae bacterium]|nr:choice-of-anchor D domain-containing protein [Myxococcaceae bacterium]